MPKRKRRAKEVVSQLATSSVREGEDISGSELDHEEAEDLEFLQESLAEGRAGFLSKIKLYVAAIVPL